MELLRARLSLQMQAVLAQGPNGDAAAPARLNGCRRTLDGTHPKKNPH
jgi:hypothetical protein